MISLIYEIDTTKNPFGSALYWFHWDTGSAQLSSLTGKKKKGGILNIYITFSRTAILKYLYVIPLNPSIHLNDELSLK